MMHFELLGHLQLEKCDRCWKRGRNQVGDTWDVLPVAYLCKVAHTEKFKCAPLLII